jgi:hypothetical protein
MLTLIIKGIITAIVLLVGHLIEDNVIRLCTAF